MKKSHFMLAAALPVALLFSCAKNTAIPLEKEPLLEGPTGVISVQLQTPASETKATSLSDNDVKSVQLFVYTSEGTLETSKYFADYNSGTDLKITAKTGSKTLYVVLNADRLNFSKMSRFDSPSTTGTDDLADLSKNTADKLIMVGKKNVDVREYDPNKNASPVTSDVSVHVKRLTSKILLDKVTVDFRNTALEGGSLDIQQIYLVNVVGKSPYGVADEGDGSAAKGNPVTLPSSHLNTMTNWYSKGTLSDGAPAVTFDHLSSNLSCNVSGNETAIGRSYLAYPNPADEYQASPSVTAPVHTCLVIKAKAKSGSLIDTPIDKNTYYTFDLPKLEANKLYRITNINITMLGADNPGERITTGKVKPTIIVDEWTDGLVNLEYDF